MSRGLSENGARLVIVESNIRPVIDQLGDETLANKALRAVREKMEFCTSFYTKTCGILKIHFLPVRCAKM